MIFLVLIAGPDHLAVCFTFFADKVFLRPGPVLLVSVVPCGNITCNCLIIFPVFVRVDPDPLLVFDKLSNRFYDHVPSCLLPLAAIV